MRILVEFYHSGIRLDIMHVPQVPATGDLITLDGNLQAKEVLRVNHVRWIYNKDGVKAIIGLESA